MLNLAGKQDIGHDARGRIANSSCKKKKKRTDKRTNHLPPLKTTGNKVNLQHFSRQRVTGQVKGFSSMKSKKSSGRQAGNATHLYWNILSRSDMSIQGQDQQKKKLFKWNGVKKKTRTNNYRLQYPIHRQEPSMGRGDRPTKYKKHSYGLKPTVAVIFFAFYFIKKIN